MSEASFMLILLPLYELKVCLSVSSYIGETEMEEVTLPWFLQASMLRTVRATPLIWC